MYENQRKKGDNWSSKYLQSGEVKAFSTENGGASADDFPLQNTPPRGYRWNSDWLESKWQYTSSFHSTTYRSMPLNADKCRRRKWQRSLEKKIYDCTYHPDMKLKELKTKSENISIVWDDGPLGITFAASVWRNGAPVVKSVVDPKKGIVPGHQLVEINHFDIQSQSFDDIMNILKQSPRPIRLTFEKIQTTVVVVKDAKIQRNASLIGLNGYDVQGLPLSQIMSLITQQQGKSITMQWHNPKRKLPVLYSNTARRVGMITAVTAVLLASSA